MLPIAIRRIINPDLLFPNCLLRDEFRDTRAAGSVNGTLATPGPGTRTVADGNSKLSIGSGFANFAVSGAATGDPGLWLNVVLRQSGRFVIGNASITAGNTEIGWDGNTAAAVTDSVRLDISDLLIRVIPNAGTAIDVGVFSSGVSYKICGVQRVTGIYWFIKGGTFTYWTLLWITAAGTADGYPAVIARNTLAVFTSDFLRVPSATFLPTPLAYDTFTRADGAIGSSETTGPDSQTTPALAWTGGAISSNANVITPTLGSELATGNLVVGNWYSITATEANYFFTGCAIGNTFRATATTALDTNNKVRLATLSSLLSSVSTSDADIVADAAVTLTAGTQAGLVLRLDSATTPANFIIAYHDGTNAKLDKCVAGTYTSVISAAATYSAGAVIRVVLDGSSVTLYYNDVKIGSTSTVSDAGILNNTIHGLFSTYSSNSLDNFTLFARGTGNEYSELDHYSA